MNTKLYFKQGFKTILKNKLQLVIVLLLAIIFSFILTSWLTVQNNLSDSYHETVRDYEKPDYTFSEKVSSAKLSIGENDDEFVPLYDFIVSDKNKNEYITYTEGDTSTTGINFMFSAKDEDDETFITETFESQDFKTLWSDFFDDGFGDYTTTAKKLSTYLTLDPAMNFLQNPFKANTKNYKLRESLNTLVSNTSYLLLQNYSIDFDKSYLDGTLIKNYVTSNSELKNNFKVASTYDAWMKDENYFANEFNSYILNAFESLPLIFLNNVIGYFTDIFSQQPDTLRLEVSDNKNISYEYQMGIAFSKKEVANNFDLKKFGDQKTSYTFEDTVTLPDSSSADSPLGMFGYSNRLEFKLADNKLSGIIFDNNKYFYSRVPADSTYASAIGGLYYNVDSTTYKTKNILSMRNFHLQISAELSNVEMRFREEAFSYDPITKINFRFVIVNDWSKIKIIDGSNSSDDSVYISKQFYENSKIKNEMKINNINVKVSGTATDALSYLQIADIDFPIVDDESTCIVYLTKENVKNIFTNVDGYGQAITFSNNYFINGSDTSLKSFMTKTFWTNNHMNDVEKNNVALKNFSDSNWNLNFSMMTKIIFAMQIIGIISLFAIAIIISYTLVSIISKCINQNKKQLQNLKVQGASATSVGTSYLGFSIMIIFGAFVIGFVLGSLLQGTFVKWFSTYAVIYKTSVNFDWVVVLILFLVIGSLVFLLNYFGTLILIHRMRFKKRNANNPLDNISEKVLKSFKLRLHYQTAMRGSFELGVLGVLTLIATLIMSSFIILISSMNNYIGEVKNTINYNNSYEANEPLYNSPLTRKSISAWDGTTNAASADGEIANYIKTLYQDTDSYEASVNNTSMIPKLIYSEDDEGIKWDDEYLFERGSLSLSALEDIFVNNAANTNARSFSIGTFEEFGNYLLHAIANPKGGTFNDDASIDPERLSQVKSFTTSFTKLIPTILAMVFGGSIPSIDDTDDWREMLLSVARGLLPNSFTKQYSSDERKTQFYFQMDADNFIPDKEDLATISNINVGNNKYRLTGVQQNQTSFNISNDVTSPFVDDDLINQISSATGDVYSNGIKIYDSASKTLTIPVITSGYMKNKLSSNAQISSRGIVLDDGTILNKNIWGYFNEEFGNENVLNEVNGGQEVFGDEEQWLNPYDLDNSKFNYFNTFKDDKVSDEAQFFVDKKITNNKLVTRLTPYYNYNNVVMFLPSDKFSIDDLLVKGDLSVNLDKYSDTISADVLKKNWYGTINSNDVPNYVKEDWGGNSDTYIWIAPYNLNYDLNFKNQNKDGSVGLMDVMGNSLNSWIDDAMTNETSPVHVDNVNVKLPNINNVKLKVVDTFDTYDSSLIITDQNLLNYVKGYSTNYVDTTPLNSRGETTGTYNSGESTVEVYNRTDPTSLVGESDVDVANNKYVVPQYFNAKLSKIDEPINLTMGLAGSLNEATGVGMLFHDGINNVKSAYKNIDLVSMKLRTVANISDIALSIALFVIVGIVLICALVVFILSDIFMSRYRDMSRMLKILGYNRFEIIWIIMLPQFLVFGITLILGVGIPFAYCGNVLNIFNKIRIEMGINITWYLMLTVALIQIAIYIAGNIYTIKKLSTDKIANQKFD